MFSPDQHQLLDFGRGRKLELFAGITLDRPCPAAEGVECRQPNLWRSVQARFERTRGDRGAWQGEAPADTWAARHGDLLLQLKLTPFGHVGLFAEQAENWDWLSQHAQHETSPLRVLNLFAYTGGATLAAAAAGAQVTHVDAARNIVAWARRNAERSALATCPIRWIVEDARKFVTRELRRGAAYDAVILDPPSYGHGPDGHVWRIDEHLPRLLEDCARLTAGRGRFMLLSCHSPGWDAPQLLRSLAQVLQAPGATAQAMSLTDLAGRTLTSGAVARWCAR